MATRLSHFFYNFILILSIILFGLLAISGFLCSVSLPNAYEIVLLYSFDNPILNLLFFAVYLTVLVLLSKLFLRFQKGDKILLVLVCLWAFCFSLLWSWLSKSGPSADAGSIYYAAKQFSLGNYSAVSYRDSYFSVYPFQLGLTLFFEIIFRLTGSTNFHILQGINAIFLVVIILTQYDLSIWTADFLKDEEQKKRVAVFYLLLTGTCLPLLFYGSFIYGEIPSFAFLLTGTCFLLRFLEKENYILGVLSLPCFCLGMMVRKNSLLFFIALFLIFVFFVSLHFKSYSGRKKIAVCVYLPVLIIGVLSIQPLVIKHYENISGATVNPGVPTSTYLAMGLMEGSAGPGGYNGFNFDTFTVAADYDSKIASEIGKEAYLERLSYFASHPEYAVKFHATKFVEQWQNPGWAVFDCLYISLGERFPIIESCFSGPLYPILMNYMSNYQMVLYFFCLLSCIQLWKNRKKFSGFALLFPLTAIGGAIFYFAWEASGRYVMPYPVFMLPNAAFCYPMIDKIFEKIFRKEKNHV